MSVQQRGVHLRWIHGLFAESARRAEAKVLREAAAKVRAGYPCTCLPDYRLRGRADPQCFRCVPMEEAALDIEAMAREREEPRT